MWRKLRQSARERLRRIPAAVRTALAVRRVQHSLTLRTARRGNMLFTSFCRVPTQLDVLANDVVEFLDGHNGGAELRVIVFGCSTGAEPYSISSVLRHRRPGLRFRIECFDIDADVIARARAASYALPELETTPPLTADFVESTFDRVADGVVVRPTIAAPVRFSVGNVLDAALIRRLGKADVVVAQNFLFHLERPDAERAFAHLFSLLRPRAALLVDGADVDIRTRLTKAAGLRACETELERIHDESRIYRGYAWPHVYWGLEPFDAKKPDAARRYATIFFSEH
jgi:chemotaxis protein methyltransferase CheR